MKDVYGNSVEHAKQLGATHYTNPLDNLRFYKYVDGFEYVLSCDTWVRSNGDKCLKEIKV